MIKIRTSRLIQKISRFLANLCPSYPYLSADLKVCILGTYNTDFRISMMVEPVSKSHGGNKACLCEQRRQRVFAFELEDDQAVVMHRVQHFESIEKGIVPKGGAVWHPGRGCESLRMSMTCRVLMPGW